MVESVFAWPGVGRLLVSAVANRDLAVVQAILMVIAAWMVIGQLHRRHRLWLARSARARRGRRDTEHGRTRCRSRSAAPTSTLGRSRRRVARLPFAVILATLWLVLMVVIALGADFLLPYSITAFDLKARLAPPVAVRRHLRPSAGHRRARPRRVLALDHVDPHEPADRPVRHADRRDAWAPRWASSPPISAAVSRR